MKITAIKGGTDWNDAGVNFVVLPPGPGIEELHVKYRDWYKGYEPGRDKFYTFPEWLKEFVGATEPGDDQLEEYWDD